MSAPCARSIPVIHSMMVMVWLARWIVAIYRQCTIYAASSKGVSILESLHASASARTECIGRSLLYRPLTSERMGRSWLHPRGQAAITRSVRSL